jgi:3-keto-5-aminohexanoate cleavage enzyme
MDKVIITAALTGAVTPKSLNPAIPITPEEIAEDAVRCYKAGAAVVHLHMRDDKAQGTMDKEKFKKTIDLIKAKCPVVINATTAGENGAPDERRMAHLEYVHPEMGSYDAGSFNWMPLGVYANSPQFLEKLGLELKRTGTKPEFEIFDSGMMGIVDYYTKKGILAEPHQYCFCLGIGGGLDATVENLMFLRTKMAPNSTWSAFGISKGHLPILYASIATGGHVRVGLEDNVYYSKGVLATNESLVQRAARVIKEADKEVATPDEARKILSLPPRTW